MDQKRRVSIRPMVKQDFPVIYQLMHGVSGNKIPEWKKWDAPYFPYHKPSFRLFKQQMLEEMEEKQRFVIETMEGEPIGIVTFYWEHRPSYWLEMGIVIYDPKYWNGGYGTQALILWMEHLFERFPLVRIGFTTWSGNERMMKVGEKCGMVLESRIRKCRHYQGVYYDSIRYGILREEWEAIRQDLLQRYFLDALKS
ncbi:GNAT family protein [Pullulanibacillus sp. KACC 23026]|uniref:GNAT family N-acetyltransferase n=1 Tax=Pullulanibacillus sp. KACC 23026 TaxID=3028315 RepID=UPI0023AF4180|nr:GNAT family protein [Pullulanibacillus sp. KACC 23026]WEG10929.1 GNAT family protein [Pullulanibacillus sp. KACC 23026]